MSPIDAMIRAIEQTRRVCFEPFSPTRWLSFGLVVLLGTCGEGLIGSGPSGGGSDDLTSPKGAARETLAFLADNGAILSGALVGALACVLLVIGLVTWVTSRGKMVYIDSVARGDVELASAWDEYAKEGNALFVLRFSVFVVGAVLSVGLVVAAAVPVLRFIAGVTSDFRELWPVLPAVFGIVLMFAVWTVFVVVVDDFLAPAMYLRRAGVGGSWSALRKALDGQLGAVIVFLIVRFGAGFLGVVLATVIGFMTCCVGFVPFVHQVLLLPVYVFLRSFSLAFIGQLGPEWSAFRDEAAGDVTPDPAET